VVREFTEDHFHNNLMCFSITMDLFVWLEISKKILHLKRSVAEPSLFKNGFFGAF